MKTKILILVAGLALFSSFSPKKFSSAPCVPATSNFTVVLTDLGGTPRTSVVGNTEYYLKASWANGNGLYQVVSIGGFTVLSSNPEDSTSPYTSFHIKTNVGSTHIHCTMVSGSGCDSSQGAVIVNY